MNNFKLYLIIILLLFIFGIMYYSDYNKEGFRIFYLIDKLESSSGRAGKDGEPGEVGPYGGFNESSQIEVDKLCKDINHPHIVNYSPTNHTHIWQADPTSPTHIVGPGYFEEKKMNYKI